jgi:hypothetical protein
VRSTSGWGRDKEIRSMIFGAKIFRLDFLFLLHQGKRKNSLDNRPLPALIVATPQNHGKDLRAGRRGVTPELSAQHERLGSR